MKRGIVELLVVLVSWDKLDLRVPLDLLAEQGQVVPQEPLGRQVQLVSVGCKDHQVIQEQQGREEIRVNLVTLDLEAEMEILENVV